MGATVGRGFEARGCGMSTVYNPYHFIPVSSRTTAQKRCDVERGKLGTGVVTHERYVPQTHSGRIVCRLTTKTPLVVGAKQPRSEGDYAVVEPYTTPDGKPAIPGSALRGMISSLAEAASNSTLRVLGDEAYTYRKPFQPRTTLMANGKPAGAHVFFEGVDKNLVPMHSGREMVTIAERMFGFVLEDAKDNAEKPRQPKAALASRIQFSDGVLNEQVKREDALEAEVPLRILSSPKPPCPAMYFL